MSKSPLFLIKVPTPTTPSSLLTDQQKQELVAYVNKYRALHQAPNMAWDNTIATFSQTWSNYLLMNNIFQHSGNSLYGENLAYFQGYGTDLMTMCKKSIDAWYNEVQLYDFNNPGFTEPTGHFTCLVWKSSTLFGMGFSSDAQTVIVSMNTSPYGNINTVEEFKNNVLPPVTTPIPITPTPVPIPITPPVIPPNITPLSKPITEEDIVECISNLYKVLNDVMLNKNKKMIIKEIKSLITQLNTYIQ